jgi:predicted site-specific integrase-resolvase
MSEKNKRFAVTYQRFSSQAQLGNSSLDRQTDSQKNWLKQNPDVVVIDSFVDQAMSGWSGKNLENGSLGVLMQAIEDNIIQAGTLILVEHFSRLTRQNIDQAEELVKKIWKAGISLVTVRDNQLYPPEAVNDMPLRIRLIVEMEQAWRESEWRSAKVKGSYIKREKNAKKGITPKMRRPFWLDKEGKLNEHHVVINDIFNWYMEGLGQQRIIVRLKEKYPNTPQVQKMNPSTIMRWLQADVVRGHWRGNKVYDAAVDDQLFYDVQIVHKSRLYENVKPDRKWLLSGLMQCGLCGRGMSIQKSKNTNPVVRCSSKQRDRSCDRKTTFPYLVVHKYLMNVALKYVLQKLTSKSSNKQLLIDMTKTQRALVKVRNKLSNEKEFYKKNSDEGKSTGMILEMMDETYQEISSLERNEKSMNELLNNQDLSAVSKTARELVFSNEQFNLEMHKIGFKIVVGEQMLSAIGLDTSIPKMEYLGYSRKNKWYKYKAEDKGGVYVTPSNLVTDDLFKNKGLFDYLNSKPEYWEAWLRNGAEFP